MVKSVCVRLCQLWRNKKTPKFTNQFGRKWNLLTFDPVGIDDHFTVLHPGDVRVLPSAGSWWSRSDPWARRWLAAIWPRNRRTEPRRWVGRPICGLRWRKMTRNRLPPRSRRWRAARAYPRWPAGCAPTAGPPGCCGTSGSSVVVVDYNQRGRRRPHPSRWLNQQRPQFLPRGRGDSNPGNPEANSQAQSGYPSPANWKSPPTFIARFRGVLYVCNLNTVRWTVISR